MGVGEWEKLCRYGGREKRSFFLMVGVVIYVCMYSRYLRLSDCERV